MEECSYIWYFPILLNELVFGVFSEYIITIHHIKTGKYLSIFYYMNMYSSLMYLFCCEKNLWQIICMIICMVSWRVWKGQLRTWRIQEGRVGISVNIFLVLVCIKKLDCCLYTFINVILASLLQHNKTLKYFVVRENIITVAFLQATIFLIAQILWNNG